VNAMMIYAGRGQRCRLGLKWALGRHLGWVMLVLEPGRGAAAAGCSRQVKGVVWQAVAAGM
jgi:hypothetical protein